MDYVIKSDRGYVTPPGSLRSYTKDVMKAQLFPTRAAAEADKCDNEVVVEYPTRRDL